VKCVFQVSGFGYPLYPNLPPKSSRKTGGPSSLYIITHGSLAAFLSSWEHGVFVCTFLNFLPFLSVVGSG